LDFILLLFSWSLHCGIVTTLPPFAGL